MIQVSVSTLLGIKPILQKLANVKMPAKKSFQVLRFLKILDKEFSAIEETQYKILKTHCKKDENDELIIDDNGNYPIKDGEQENFNKEVEEFLNMEIEIECEKVNIDFFEGIELTPNQIIAVEPFIKEE